MVLGKLRMKNSDDTSAKLNEKKPTKRSRRQTTRSPSIDPTPPPYGYTNDESMDIHPSGSSAASRAYHQSKGKQIATDPEIGEELVINWTTSSSEVANRLLSIPLQNHREFNYKLQDALRDEEEIRFERLLDEDQYLPKRWKSNEFGKHQVHDLKGSALSRMEGEDYDEYIRKRMWSRSNRTQYLNLKEKEEKEKAEEIKRKENRKQQKLRDQEKVKNRAEKEIKRKEKDLKRFKESYEAKWNMINSLQTLKNHTDDLIETPNQNLSFDQIPWPIFPAEESDDFINRNHPKIDLINRFTSKSIKDFLFKDIEDSNLKKKIVRSTLLLYHPDRFDSLIIQRIKNHQDEKEKEKAKEIGLRVSQILNEINQEI